MSNRMLWEKFWWRDFIEDLRPCTASARGVWISILCYLWGAGRIPRITGTIVELAQIASVTPAEIETAVQEFELRDICNVIHSTNLSGTPEITIECRRLTKDQQIRKKERVRKYLYRHQEKEEQTPAPEEEERDGDPRYPWGEFKNVLLSNTDMEKLSEKFPLEKINRAIEEMSIWLKSKSKTYKDYRAALIGWIQRDLNSKGGKKNVGTTYREPGKQYPRGSSFKVN